MTEDEEPTPPAPSRVIRWLQKEIGNGCTLHTLIESGEGEHSWYYLGLWTGPHPEGDDLGMVDLRYIQWPKPDSDMQPTLKKNGMKMRDDGALLPRLLKGVARARNEQNADEDYDEPLWIPK